MEWTSCWNVLNSELESGAGEQINISPGHLSSYTTTLCAGGGGFLVVIGGENATPVCVKKNSLVFSHIFEEKKTKTGWIGTAYCSVCHIPTCGRTVLGMR